ncbi:cyclin-A1 [Betta splendens]|uniref:G2/mitotic-specific cyclin-B2 n=1 Tax=Betta splendens TaxID=158456 RepID=A0A6P7PWU5_BETSP|nr:cyclin-A1 [Betta splendens]
MNFNTSVQYGSRTSKENVPPSSTTKPFQVQGSRQRSVLGVLSENEPRGRSSNQGSQLSRRSAASDCSQFNHLGCWSSSSYDVCVEEAREVVLAASGHEEVSGGCYPDNTEHLGPPLHSRPGSCRDALVQFEPDEPMLRPSEYTEDIHRHLREREMELRPRPDYLRKHPEVTGGMRLVLVDWLAEVTQEYKLCSETLHLAVNYVDRFLSRAARVTRAKLQLVGTAALLIAAKYEETSPPELGEFADVTDNAYTSRQLVRMEHFVLRVLRFDVAAPTASQFLRLFACVHAVCARTRSLALYVAELSLLEMEPFLQYPPSKVAAAAFCLASYTVDKSLWPDSLRVLTGYTVGDIAPCVAELHRLHVAAERRPEQAVRERFKSPEYYGVSWVTPPPALPFL